MCIRDSDPSVDDHGRVGRGGGAQPRGHDLRHAVSYTHLAPSRLGDLLDGSVKHIRRNPGPVLGVSALANAFSVLPVLVLVTAARCV